jgi:drug/metabolite transporter (DMT)-like permease
VAGCYWSPNFKSLTMSTKILFGITAIFAFASFISFIQIGSAWADANNANGIAGFLGLGILLGIVAIYFLARVVKQSGGSRHDD